MKVCHGYDEREKIAIFGELRSESEAALERAVAAMPAGAPDAVTGRIGDAFQSRLAKINRKRPVRVLRQAGR